MKPNRETLEVSAVVAVLVGYVVLAGMTGQAAYDNCRAGIIKRGEIVSSMDCHPTWLFSSVAWPIYWSFRLGAEITK